MSSQLAHGLKIRKATPDDAAALIEHVNRVVEESPFLLLEPGEFDYTVEQEQKMIADANASDNNLFLVALVDGRVIGVLTCFAGKRRSARHAVTLGISIRQAWCGRGIGRRMLQAAIDWAKSTGVVRRIELQVFTENRRAIRLYEEVGFVHEGHRRGSARRNGQPIDDYIMALTL
jgi:RimJ/RimL family protein N-acetyltransferase